MRVAYIRVFQFTTIKERTNMVSIGKVIQDAISSKTQAEIRKIPICC